MYRKNGDTYCWIYKICRDHYASTYSGFFVISVMSMVIGLCSASPSTSTIAVAPLAAVAPSAAVAPPAAVAPLAAVAPPAAVAPLAAVAPPDAVVPLAAVAPPAAVAPLAVVAPPAAVALPVAAGSGTSYSGTLSRQPMKNMGKFIGLFLDSFKGFKRQNFDDQLAKIDAHDQEFEQMFYSVKSKASSRVCWGS